MHHSSSSGAQPVEFLWRTTGGSEPFASVTAFDFDREGNLWVADGGHNQFQIFAPDGSHLETWGEAGSGDGQFNLVRPNGEGISGIAFAPDGGFYVADSQNRRIQRFDAERNFVRAWGGFGTDDGQFLEPIDVNIDAEGNVFVVDDERDEVQKFDSEGNFLLKFGGHGTGEGQLNFTGGGAFDSAGNVWIADFGNSRVQQFAHDGTYLTTFGTRGTDPGEFIEPDQLEIDAEDRIFVTDVGNARMQVFDLSGQLLATLTGDDAGGTRFGEGTDAIALDGQVHVYISDFDEAAGYEAVQKFRLLPPLGPEVMATPAA